MIASVDLTTRLGEYEGDRLDEIGFLLLILKTESRAKILKYTEYPGVFLILLRILISDSLINLEQTLDFILFYFYVFLLMPRHLS